MARSLCCPPKTITALLISYILQFKIKKKMKKKGPESKKKKKKTLEGYEY